MENKGDMKSRRDKDNPNRYPARHLWLPDRPHKGFSQNGDMTAFGDESLYHPSRLGTAAISPSTVQANATAPLRLSFTAGLDGLLKGSKVSFITRGQQPLGKQVLRFQTVAPDGCGVEICGIGFLLKEGLLNAGETVELIADPFCWTPLAGLIIFNVVISEGGDLPEKRLPEPLVIEILPGQAAQLEATVPCVHSGDTVTVRVTLRDARDNRVPANDQVIIDAGAGSGKTAMRDGLAYAPFPANRCKVVRAQVCTEKNVFRTTSNPSVKTEESGYYIGDLHSHDFMSEAAGFTDEVYRWAIEDRSLDFVSVVPQAHGWLDNQTWTVAKYMNERYLREGSFVTFLGFEWQHTGYGDKVIHYLGGDQPYLPVDDTRYNNAAKLYAALRKSDAIVISHHPCYPAGSWCSSTDFDTVETDVDRLVELWSMHGSSEGWDPADRPLKNFDPERQVMAALRRGVRMGFTGGSDTHSGRPGGSAKEPYPHWGGLTGVWAESLTRRALFAALRNRNTCALTGARIILKFTVNGALMGSEIQSAESADIRIDTWAPGNIARVEVVKNTRLLKAFTPDSDECHLHLEDKPCGSAFYHCRVVQTDGQLAVSSPVWIG